MLPPGSTLPSAAGPGSLGPRGPEILEGAWAHSRLHPTPTFSQSRPESGSRGSQHTARPPCPGASSQECEPQPQPPTLRCSSSWGVSPDSGARGALPAGLEVRAGLRVPVLQHPWPSGPAHPPGSVWVLGSLPCPHPSTQARQQETAKAPVNSDFIPGVCELICLDPVHQWQEGRPRLRIGAQSP